MSAPLTVEPEAAAELEEAVQWYEQRGVGLGLEFARLVRAVLARIERSTLQFCDVDRGIRRAIVRRFPYAVYFVIDPDRISVLAIFHHRRHPGHWRSRR